VRGTIKSCADINTIFNEGSKLVSSTVIVIMRPTPGQRGQYGRVAFIAGKKLGNAPTRNRAKRVIREAVRALPFSLEGFDLIFIARDLTAKQSSEHLRLDLINMLKNKLRD